MVLKRKPARRCWCYGFSAVVAHGAVYVLYNLAPLTGDQPPLQTGGNNCCQVPGDSSAILSKNSFNWRLSKLQLR